MTEPRRLRQTIDDAREHGVPAWDPVGAPRFIERAEARRRRRRTASALGAVTLAAAAAILVWTSTFGEAPTPIAEAPTPTPAPTVEAPTAPSNVLRFAEGSLATPASDDSELYVDRAAPDAIELVLTRGAARFEVTPGLSRAFRVRAGSVIVSVVGTVFTVRREGAGATVEVEEGRVRIEWGTDGLAEISAGERGTYPVAAASTPTVRDEHTTHETLASSDRPVPRDVHRPSATESPSSHEPTPAPSWRALALAGRYDDGYALILADREVLRSDDVEALMLAADCARLSGHPAESLAYLRRGLVVGAEDYRAPIIAFTLGRVLLQQLHRPEEAVDAFARVRQLAPQGVLAQDALAREVEAAHDAGLRDRAHALALEYVRLYPDDGRSSAVRRLGGLE